MTSRVSIVGLDPLLKPEKAALVAIEEAEIIVGSERQFDVAKSLGVNIDENKQVMIGKDRADLDAVLDQIAISTKRYCLLATGDPGYFGLLRLSRKRINSREISVFPSVSSISRFCAKIGIPWESVPVISFHGRQFTKALTVARSFKRIIALCSPEATPSCILNSLDLEAFSYCAIGENIGFESEAIYEGSPNDLINASFCDNSIVVLLDSLNFDEPTVVNQVFHKDQFCFGRKEEEFGLEFGKVTKPEARVIALSKLGLPTFGSLLEIGAGSGSMTIEAKELSPGIEGYVIERDRSAIKSLKRNLEKYSCRVHLLEGEAENILPNLGQFDRIIVSGGGIRVIEMALKHLSSGGKMVTLHANINSALDSAKLLGNILQTQISNGIFSERGDVRFRSRNPVFICWGGV